MSVLSRSTNLEVSEDHFLVALDAEWEGWGPAGGYLAAIALRAAACVVPAGHRPVTLQAQFLAKAERGTAIVRAQVRKLGSSTMVNVTLCQGERTFFQAQIWSTSKSEGPSICRVAMPATPAPEQLQTLEHHFEALGRSTVAFWSKLDCRPVEFRAPGGPPATTDRLVRWYRFREGPLPDEVFDYAGHAAVLIDANIWAAHWRMLDSEPDYAGPSLDLTVWFHDLAAGGDWLLLDAVSPFAANAIVHGTASLWTQDGRLVASGGGNCLVVPFARPGTGQGALTANPEP